jgi:hypothetical protein
LINIARITEQHAVTILFHDLGNVARKLAASKSALIVCAAWVKFICAATTPERSETVFDLFRE